MRFHCFIIPGPKRFASNPSFLVFVLLISFETSIFILYHIPFHNIMIPYCFSHVLFFSFVFCFGGTGFGWSVFQATNNHFVSFCSFLSLIIFFAFGPSSMSWSCLRRFVGVASVISSPFVLDHLICYVSVDVICSKFCF